MNLTSHAHILIGLCYSMAALMGLPSLAGVVYFGYVKYLAWTAPPVESSMPTSSDATVQAGYTIAGYLMSGLKLIGSIGEAIATGLLVASIVLLTMAGGLFVTARGLSGNAVWARWTTGAAMCGVLGISLILSLLSGGGLIGRGALLMAGAAAYGLWVVGWRLTA